jgi:Xaa-Pro aminopeptidase
MSVYETRRTTFMEKMQPDSVAILKSAPEFALSQGMELPYRQNSEFYYLTGLEEQEAICVLAPNHF